MNQSLALRLSPALAIIVACVSFAAPSRADTAELSLRSKVAFVPNDITINGLPRPDIGRALADSFSAAALKRGKVRVFNVDVPVVAVKPAKGKKNLGSLGAVATSKGGIGAPPSRDLDYLYTFNLVGEDDRYSLTMKKVRAENNEVVEAHEMSTTGRLDRVFSLVPQALDHIDAKLYPPAFPRTQSPAEIRSAVPVIVRDAPAWNCRPGTWSGVPPEYADIDLSKVPKALIYQRLGSITAAVDPWRFAIITPTTSARINTNEVLDVQWGDGGPGVYSRLKVSGHDSGKVIADYGANPSYHRLYPGDSVYGWAPPVH